MFVKNLERLETKSWEIAIIIISIVILNWKQRLKNATPKAKYILVPEQLDVKVKVVLDVQLTTLDEHYVVLNKVLEINLI